MLNKKICYKCYLTTLDKKRPFLQVADGSERKQTLIDTFNFLWENHSKCVCYNRDLFSGSEYFCSTIKLTDNPPETCPYLLEQLVNQKDKPK